MFMSNLPTTLRFFSSWFLFGSVLFAGCSSANSEIKSHENLSPPRGHVVVNINSASAAELESLPEVGPALARKIIEHRERYGAFRKPEHLLVIEGMSEDRFRELRQFIDTE
jgi:competence ComEA-like helix-hairpin-helix protein